MDTLQKETEASAREVAFAHDTLTRTVVLGAGKGREGGREESDVDELKEGRNKRRMRCASAAGRGRLRGICQRLR